MSDDFYRAFEDRHRGPRDLIKSRLRAYLPFVEPLRAIYAPVAVVDLGCGRGEWLELMREAGIDARGVDLDDAMLADCRQHGLAAEQGDALVYLRALPDESMAVVSGFHFAEHIALADLQRVVQEALRVLKPGGLLILETPNPENLRVGTSSFYCDPTHQRPLPPALLSFLPEYYGFARTKILRLQEPAGLSEHVDVNLKNVLTDVSPDCAVVAQKACLAPGQAELFDAAFAMRFGIDLETLAARFDSGLAGKLAEILAEAERSAELEARARSVEQALALVREQVSENEKRNTKLTALVSEVRQETIERMTRIELMAAQADERNAEIARLNTHIAALRSSASWRLTAPMRLAGTAAANLAHTLPRAARRLLDGFAVVSERTLCHPIVMSLTRHVGKWVLARPRIANPIRTLLQRHPKLSARLADIVLFPAASAELSNERGTTYHWADAERPAGRSRGRLTGSAEDIDELMLRIEDEVRRWRAERQ